MNLIEQIQMNTAAIKEAESVLRVWKERAADLDMQRAYCKHDFSVSTVGYVHEGLSCSKCGINDQYAPLLKEYWNRKKEKRNENK